MRRLLGHHVVRCMKHVLFSIVRKIMVHLKSSVLDSMKYSINDCILSALGNSEKTNSLLILLLISNLFFFSNPFFFFSFYKWTPITFTTGPQSLSLKNNAVDWNHFAWTQFPPCWLLLNDLLQSPICLSGRSKPSSTCTSCCPRPHLPLCLADFLEKQRKSPGPKEASVC